MKDNNCLEFDYTQMAPLGALIASLNQNGVPYALHQDNHAVHVIIGKGY